ncbi:MAG: pyridoxal phosphate-dependent aminotransferase [Candidatus Diapherotrites archaeon]|nr:pyridoxal phosphate-dependent aminotransferase [Candidatus Diapherotrites archaeon]MDZ4255987.1 pyridoxal phosphate-dependent aminotransferase [archaeon]
MPYSRRIPKTRWGHILSERVANLPESEFESIMGIAKERPDIISLGPGEPDFSSPTPVIRATQEALQKGQTHYSAIPGLKELREAISRKLKKENHIFLEDPENEVCVTAGSTEGLLLGLMSIVDVGEEVLVPDPGFLAYTPMVDLVTGNALPYRLKDEDGFQIHPEELEAQITNKTRTIILNSPSNPTGTVLKRKVLEEIADIAVEHELIIFSDEAYEKLVFGKGKHVSMAALEGMHDHVLTFQSFSKSFAMPGFRIGYVAGHHELVRKIGQIHVYTSLTASTANQYGALKALSLGKKYVERMRTSYDQRRKLVLKHVNEMKTLHVEVEPEGAFYVFPRITTKQKSRDYAHALVKKAKVLMVPGNEFGRGGEGFMRISYATSTQQINEAFERMKKAGF